MKKVQRPRKYFAPQHEDHTRKCDHPGCTKKGEFKAPKDKDLKEYYWFCLEHVQEYNKQWNYYGGEEPKKEEPKPKMHFKGFNSKVKYNFRDYTGIFGEYASDFEGIDNIYYNREEKRLLDLLELTPKELNLDSLKKQYKKLVKKYHPDVNQGDKEKEDKFKEISIAYNKLLAVFQKIK